MGEQVREPPELEKNDQEESGRVDVVVVGLKQPRERAGWADYQAFTRFFGVEAVEATIQRLNPVSHPPLFGVWVVGDPRFLKS